MGSYDSTPTYRPEGEDETHLNYNFLAPGEGGEGGLLSFRAHPTHLHLPAHRRKN